MRVGAYFILSIIWLFSHNVFAAYPLPWQMNLQAYASPVMQELHYFHNFILVISVAVVSFVIFLIGYVCVRFNATANPIPAKFTHNILIEIIWTVIPIIILIVIAIPSFRILRMMENIPPADMTVKVVGSQWFWSYVYPDHGNIGFDSYMIQDADLKAGQLRLLEVDNRVVIPQGVVVKFLVTAADVIHSFAIPSLGIKIDAVPGRVNETWVKIDKIGVYYGQCSELCGINHGFMPIAIEVVSQEDFAHWLAQAKVKFADNKNKLLTDNKETFLYGNQCINAMVNSK